MGTLLCIIDVKTQPANEAHTDIHNMLTFFLSGGHNQKIVEVVNDPAHSNLTLDHTHQGITDPVEYAHSLRGPKHEACINHISWYSVTCKGPLKAS